jgi:hypothetical protein
MQIKTYWDEDAREIDVVLCDATGGSAAFTFSQVPAAVEFSHDLSDLLDRYGLNADRSAAQAHQHATSDFDQSNTHTRRTHCPESAREHSR